VSETSEDDFQPYDPVESGIISKAVASTLLDEFKTSFVSQFPFVVVPSNTGADDLRKNKPFLFLAIMAVTTYRNPLIQKALAIKLKAEIANRIIERSHKSLEILQGLLVYVTKEQRIPTSCKSPRQFALN
jgi:hypothetical protein